MSSSLSIIRSVTVALFVLAALLSACAQPSAAAPSAAGGEPPPRAPPATPVGAGQRPDTKAPKPASPVDPGGQGARAPSLAASNGSSEACRAICAHSVALRCGSLETCLGPCLEMLRSGPCDAEMKSFMKCAGSEPTASWECDLSTSTPALREGRCEAEQEQMAGCMLRRAQ